MIKAILFDFDGVLTTEKTGSGSTVGYLSRTCGLPPEFVESCYHKYNRALTLGDLTHRDMWDSFCQELGQAIDYQVLLDSFVHTALDENMLALVKELKEKYLVALVTDNKTDRLDAILDTRGLRAYFDAVAVSAALHAGKDSVTIFQYVLDRLSVAAEACVFIDNKERNLLIPRQMGMKTLLFDDEARDFAAFKNQLSSLLPQQSIQI